MARIPARRANAAVRLLLVLTLAAPVLAFVGVLGTRTGLWDWRVGHDLILMRLAWYAALAGGVGALAAVGLAFVDARRSAPLAAAAVLVAGGVLGAFAWSFARNDATTAPDVATSPEDLPGYSDRVIAQRRAAGAVPADRWADRAGDCDLPGPIARQVAPGAAAWALEQAGFDVLGYGVARADGTRTSFWFGFTHDAVVRIRPGRTDVRVTAREDRPDGGEACRLARSIVASLQTGR